ncbi:MAG: hypothetical protein J5710_11685 [Treponema sp.]|nr:hypothetical protein [Treponema sp.]
MKSIKISFFVLMFALLICGNAFSAEYKFHEVPEILPAGTGGTLGKEGVYVLFGDWPQTIKADNVTVDENKSEVHGAFTYYRGSDGCWYVKCAEDALVSYYKYSDGTEVAESSANSTKYFKVEPIKWRVLTKDYNGSGKALLLAENILTANVEYYDYYNVDRTVNGNTVYPNNYKESKIRAYLNGLSYYKQSSSSSSMTTEDIYNNKGFLQTAFTSSAQKRIATTTVDNTAESTTDSGNNIYKATKYVCENTSDKIFLLSEKEVTTSNYGFDVYDSYGTGNTRIRVTTDFAKANYASQSSESDYGGWWWLRSPFYDYSDYARYVSDDGDAGYIDSNVSYARVGVVPALSISLQ